MADVEDHFPFEVVEVVPSVEVGLKVVLQVGPGVRPLVDQEVELYLMVLKVELVWQASSVLLIVWVLQKWQNSHVNKCFKC